MQEQEGKGEYRVPAGVWQQAMQRSGGSFKRFLEKATFTLPDNGKINGLKFYRRFVANAKPTDPITVRWKGEAAYDGVLKVVEELRQPGVLIGAELADLRGERAQIQQRLKELDQELLDLDREIRNEVFRTPESLRELIVLGVGELVRLIFGATLSGELLMNTWKVDREA